MKAFRYYGPGNAEIEEIPIPSIGPGEVLISMGACGICGTDIKTFLRGHPKIPPGAVLGHEVAGQVIASEAPNFEKGDRVVAAPYVPCLTCAMCQRKHFSLCENLFAAFLDPGGFAEFIRVPKAIVERGLFHIPAGLDLGTASLAEPLACCVHGLEALNVQSGQSLLVVGDGPMGLLQAALGKALGAGPIILSGITPERLDFARQLVDVVVDVSKENLPDVIKEVTAGGADKVIISVGDLNVAQDTLSLARKGGAVNLFAGMPRGSAISLDAAWIHYSEVRILGTFGFGPEHFRRALELLAGEKLSVSGLFTSTVTLDGIKDALIAASRYEGIKTLVVTNLPTGDAE